MNFLHLTGELSAWFVPCFSYKVISFTTSLLLGMWMVIGCWTWLLNVLYIQGQLLACHWISWDFVDFCAVNLLAFCILICVYTLVDIRVVIVESLWPTDIVSNFLVRCKISTVHKSHCCILKVNVILDIAVCCILLANGVVPIPHNSSVR